MTICNRLSVQGHLFLQAEHFFYTSGFRQERNTERPLRQMNFKLKSEFSVRVGKSEVRELSWFVKIINGSGFNRFILCQY